MGGAARAGRSRYRKSINVPTICLNVPAICRPWAILGGARRVYPSFDRCAPGQSGGEWGLSLSPFGAGGSGLVAMRRWMMVSSLVVAALIAGASFAFSTTLQGIWAATDPVGNGREER